MVITRSLPQLDYRLCVAVNQWSTGHAIVVGFFGTVSRLGDGLFWYALMVGLASFNGARGMHAVVHMLCTGLVALLLYRCLKRWTRRPRPFRSCERIRASVAPLDEFSFPSGHTLHAVSFSIVALAYFPALAPALLPFAALVAASRVVLGLHYPSDVLAALAIGVGVGETSLWLGSSMTMFASAQGLG
jgi:undecaprenyl-diphosphatase